jgi:hypothetical protein
VTPPPPPPPVEENKFANALRHAVHMLYLGVLDLHSAVATP